MKTSTLKKIVIAAAVIASSILFAHLYLEDLNNRAIDYIDQNQYTITQGVKCIDLCNECIYEKGWKEFGGERRTTSKSLYNIYDNAPIYAKKDVKKYIDTCLKETSYGTVTFDDLQRYIY